MGARLRNETHRTQQDCHSLFAVLADFLSDSRAQGKLGYREEWPTAKND